MTTTVNTPDMRAALIEARDWFESQAKAVSKGCGSSYELHDLRMQRDALDAALAAPAQDDDALTAAYMAGSHDAKKAARTAAKVASRAAESRFDSWYAKEGGRCWGTQTQLAREAYIAGLGERGAHGARQLPTDKEIIDLAINLRRPPPHEYAHVLLTGAGVDYKLFRSGGESMWVHADDLVLFARAAIEAAHGIAAQQGATP